MYAYLGCNSIVLIPNKNAYYYEQNCKIKFLIEKTNKLLNLFQYAHFLRYSNLYYLTTDKSSLKKHQKIFLSFTSV